MKQLPNSRFVQISYPQLLTISQNILAMCTKGYGNIIGKVLRAIKTDKTIDTDRFSVRGTRT